MSFVTRDFFTVRWRFRKTVIFTKLLIALLRWRAV